MHPRRCACLPVFVPETDFCFSYTSSRKKLAKLPLDWSTETNQATNTDIRARLKLTHEEIGQMLGTSRETVSRIIEVMESRHSIDSQRTVLRNLRTAIETLEAKVAV